MKKKLAGIATLAALMTLSAGITAFAGWDVDAWGETVFRNSSGNIVYAGWVTDPDTGFEYYMDPDGHMMRGTTVEGYWLDDDGIKHEKSEAQLAAEERRAAREAAYNTPGKEKNAANELANEAKTTGVASSTTRRNYQAEMYTLSNQAFATVKKGVTEYERRTMVGATSKTNISDKFYYYSRAGIDILSSEQYKAVAGTDAYYDVAEEIHYNRNIISEEDAVEVLNQGFLDLLIAALGENQGNYVYSTVMAIPIGDDAATLNFDGYTDTGNYYTVRYSVNNAYIDVTCSEIVPVDEEEAAELGEEAGADFAEEVTEEMEGEGVIVAGAAEEQIEEEAAEEIAEEILEEEAAQEAYEEAYNEAVEEALDEGAVAEAAEEAAADEAAVEA